MDVKERITQALAAIMSPDELAITTVFFGPYDDGVTKCNMWQFSQPGIHPTFLGIDLLDALETIDYYNELLTEAHAEEYACEDARLAAYAFPFIGKPFSGNSFRERQVGPIVCHIRHKGIPSMKHTFHIGRFHAWIDPAWFHEVRH